MSSVWPVIIMSFGSDYFTIWRFLCFVLQVLGASWANLSVCYIFVSGCLLCGIQFHHYSPTGFYQHNNRFVKLKRQGHIPPVGFYDFCLDLREKRRAFFWFGRNSMDHIQIVILFVFTDKHARYVDHETKPVPAGSVPPLHDIPLSQVSKVLYKDWQAGKLHVFSVLDHVPHGPKMKEKSFCNQVSQDYRRYHSFQVIVECHYYDQQWFSKMVIQSKLL